MIHRHKTVLTVSQMESRTASVLASTFYYSRRVPSRHEVYPLHSPRSRGDHPSVLQYLVSGLTVQAIDFGYRLLRHSYHRTKGHIQVKAPNWDKPLTVSTLFDSFEAEAHASETEPPLLVQLDLDKAQRVESDIEVLVSGFQLTFPRVRR